MPADWCALLVRVSLWFVLVGSGYLHALNLVSLVRAGWCPGWKWLPACLETRVLGSCALLVRAGWKWLPACLEPRILVAWCALLVRVLVGVVTCMP